MSTDQNPSTDPSTATSPRTEGSKLAGCYALSRKLEVVDGAEVWLAHDEVLGKDVSLHFMPDSIARDARALQELRLDIKRNRQLIHPNILRVYDLVEEPDWVAVSMDAFEGESLARHISRQEGKGCKVDEIRAWADQLANTLEEAHKINVVHRDLSPSNLFLTPAGKLLVANFGISRTVHDAQARAGETGASNVGCQSPQSREGKPVTRVDDVYSFGAVLFTALTGHAPNGRLEALAALQDPALNVPANWRTTIAACLDKNPDARPQSATEVARRLSSPAEETPSVSTSPAPASASSAPAPVIAAAAPAPAAAAAPAPAPGESKSAPAPAPVVAEPAPAAPETKSASIVAEPAPAALEPKLTLESKPAPPAPKPEPAMSGPAPVIESKPAQPTFELKPAVAPVETKSAPILEPVKPAAEIPPASKPAETPAKESRKQLEAVKPSPAPKGPDRPLASDYSPRLYPTESRFPVMPLAAAAAVIVVIAIIYHFAKGGKSPEVAADQQPEKAELRSLTPPANPSTPAPDSPTVQTNQTKEPVKPAPVAEATPSPVAKAISEKTTALAKAKQEAEAAEKAQADLLKQQQAAEASLAEVQKTIETKTASAKSMKKAAEESAAQRKKLEDEKKAAEAAALEAQKMAAEKARLAEVSAKALLDLDKANAEKMAGPEQVEKEIADLQKDLEAKQRTVADGAKALAQAESTKQQQLAAVAENEREIERIKSSDMEAQRQKQAAEAEKTKLNDELAEMQRIFKEKMDALEAKRKQLENPGAPAPAPATPVPTSSSRPAPAVVAPTATPPMVASLTTPKPAPTAPPIVPAPSVVTAPNTAAPAAVPTAGGNSLGLKFVPIGDVEFCIWQTRVKDFEVFAKAVNLRSTSWKGPGFKQGPDHPVVNVSWQEAVAFCKWLTDKEHKDNVLPAAQYYRLPTDLEWSKAVGLPEESGKTPELRDMGVPDVYPWGTAWPPPAGAGNYTGEETGSDVAIKGYDDGFAWTSPVGSFPPNKFGLYDMGGNVWQWCMDTWNADSKAKVLRGASWYNGALKLSLLSSCRVHAAPDSSTDNYGFRIVRAKEDAKPGKK